MRWVHLAIVVLFAAGILLFLIQNFGPVTISYLGFSIRAPLAVLAGVIYVLGAASGGSLFALIRNSWASSRTQQ